MRGLLILSWAHAGPLADYQGKYAGSEAFQLAFQDLDARVSRAAQVAGAATGLPAHPARVVVEDGQPWPFGTPDAPSSAGGLPPPLPRPELAPFVTRWLGPEREVELHLRTEAIVSRAYDLDAELVHEQVHVLMRGALAPELYERVPPWLQEGLALWVAASTDPTGRYGPAVIHRNLDTTAGWASPDRFLPGLEEGPFSLGRYPESYLAVDHLVRSTGPEAAPRLLQLLVEGTPPREALETVTGVPWATFREGARAHGRRALQGARPRGWRTYVRLLNASLDRRESTVVRLGERYLRRWPNERIAPHVTWLTARSQPSEADRLAGARRVASGPITPWTPDALLAVAASDQDASLYLQVLRDHPGCRCQPEAVLGLVATDDAAFWGGLFVASWPTHRSAGPIRETLGLPPVDTGPGQPTR